MAILFFGRLRSGREPEMRVAEAKDMVLSLTFAAQPEAAQLLQLAERGRTGIRGSS